MTHAILVLGAAMRAPGDPGPALIRRARHGAMLWQAAPGAWLVASGAGGEAEAIAGICRAAGVPEGRIVLEPEARNTAENIALATPLMAARGVARVTLVSDYYHLPRACLIARRAGWTVEPRAPRHGFSRPHRHGFLVLREGVAYLAALGRIR